MIIATVSFVIDFIHLVLNPNKLYDLVEEKPTDKM